jgi:hypothetical protein
LATEVGRMLQALPATLAELTERVLEARRRGDDAVLPGRRIHVALAIERRQHLAAEAGAFLEHCLGGVEAGLLEAGQAGDRLQIGELLHAEEHVLDGGDVAHGANLDSRIAVVSEAKDPGEATAEFLRSASDDRELRAT